MVTSRLRRSSSVGCCVSWVDGIFGWSSFVVEVLLILVISMIAGGVFLFFRSECRLLAMMLDRVSGMRQQVCRGTSPRKFSVSFQWLLLC